MISASPTGPATLVDGDLPGARDAGECVVDAPDRAQQAHERRSGTHGGQQHLAVLQLVPSTPCKGIPQHAGELLRPVTRRSQRARTPVARVAAISGSTSASRSNAGQALPRIVQRRRLPERGNAARHIVRARAQQPAFQRITTQLATDMASSNSATSRLTASPWRSAE
jgi:hypothetical protein